MLIFVFDDVNPVFGDFRNCSLGRNPKVIIKYPKLIYIHMYPLHSHIWSWRSNECHCCRAPVMPRAEMQFHDMHDSTPIGDDSGEDTIMA